jgi:outer membrane protein assembly factor BamB
MWFTQVDIAVGSDETHLTQHVNSKKAITIHQVTSDRGRFLFSERDVDRFGVIVGPENAKKAAQLKFDELTNLKLNPKLEAITVPQITLVAVSNSGVVQAIDAETGRTMWKVGLGNPRYPTEPAGMSDDYVAVVNGSDLYLLKAEDGEFIWKRKVVGSPGAGPAISSHMVFVPMISGAMEGYEIANTAVPPMIYRSQGRAMWQPVYTGSNVAWPTDRGHLYVSGAVQHRISFRLEANDAIAASAAVMAPDRLVVSSVDGFMYCLQETSGVVAWRFSSGEPILDSPLVYGDTVYAVTVDRNVFAIDSELGQERWTTSGVTKVIAATQGRLYCLSNTREILVLDRQTGSRIGALPTNALDLSYTNKETDRILLTNSRGTIQCLREIQQEFPLIHVSLAKQEVKAPKPTRKTPAKADGAPADAPVDPFSTGPAPATKPADTPPPADPFGD